MKRKGFTLVEILVSLCVFLIIFAGVLTTYSLSVKGTNKLEEYTYFEKLCLDIDKIYDNEGYQSLRINVFMDNSKDIPGETVTSTDNLPGTSYKNDVYYDASYQLLDDKTNSKYKLSYDYTIYQSSDGDDTTTAYSKLIISIYNLDKNYYVIEKLDYGNSNVVYIKVSEDTSNV